MDEQLEEFAIRGRGLKCGHCGSALPRIADTRQTDGMVIRKRLCAKCGRVNETMERVFSTRGKRSYMNEVLE